MKLLTSLVLVVAGLVGVHGIPATPHYFTQLVDHFAGTSAPAATFQQRYYMNDTFFKGAGSPIFMIMGGEGAIEPSTGIYYPYIVDLAHTFGALVIEPEHRFYGTSLPADTSVIDNLRRYLTPQQALEDAIALLVDVQHRYNCNSSLAQTATACPVLTIGGSYPGFLSAMMRIRYPGVVNFAYSASAPLLFYSQQVDQYKYYEKVTQSAEQASVGCGAAVHNMLTLSIGAANVTKAEIVAKLQLCSPLPAYIDADATPTTLRNEINMIVMYSFANLNMANYPPPNTTLKAACAAIQIATDPWQALNFFLSANALSDVQPHLPTALPLLGHRRASQHPNVHRHTFTGVLINNADAPFCYNLSSQLPAGPNATISSGDWSGVGTGADGESWDFETCTFNIETIGTNGVTDMFLPREWTLQWLQQHCSNRFGVAPTPRALADAWGFDRLDEIGTSHIYFTNGDKDGWSVGGVPAPGFPHREIYSVYLPNGAHHSDLAHNPPSNTDTSDIQQVHADFENVLRKWLTNAPNPDNNNASDDSHTWRNAFIIVAVVAGVAIVVLACWLRRVYRGSSDWAKNYHSAADA